MPEAFWLASKNRWLTESNAKSRQTKYTVCPSPKKRDPEDEANYHLVSLTSVLCKLFEKMLKRLCFCFLQRHDPFQLVSMDSFLVDPAYPTFSFRKNV